MVIVRRREDQREDEDCAIDAAGGRNLEMARMEKLIRRG